jgi:heptosyltransferase I
MRVLVVRLSAIGDVVHTLPVLLALERAGHEVSWLVEPLARPLLEGRPSLRVFSAPLSRRFSLRAALATAAALQRQRFDVALDLQGLWKSAVWARLSGARWVMGPERRARREGLSALLQHRGAPVPSSVVHVIDKNLAVLRAIGIDAMGLREFPFPAAAALSADQAALTTQPFAILCPGGGWASKLWPAASHGALAREIAARGLLPVVTWGPGEDALAQTVAAASEGTARVAPATTLPELVELIRRARLVVAADTGPLHIACAVGTPVVALFGPTDPARNGPFLREDIVLRRVPPCAPCYSRTCTVHAGILSGTPVAEVAEAAATRLAHARAATA